MAVEADKQWTRRCVQEYHKLATQYQLQKDLYAVKRLGTQKSYRDQGWQDTTNRLKVTNSNPFKDTDGLKSNTDHVFTSSKSGTATMFKEAHIWNPIGPPCHNTGDFHYLSGYSNGKQQAEGMNKTFYASQTPNNKRGNCWTFLGESKSGLGRSGLPQLTDKRLGQQKLNSELAKVQKDMSNAEMETHIMKFKSMKKDFGLSKKARRHNSLVPFSRTPNSNSYAGKFHDYHLSVNPFETTIFDDSVITNMVNAEKVGDRLGLEAQGDEELEALLSKIRRFKGQSQRYS